MIFIIVLPTQVHGIGWDLFFKGFFIRFAEITLAVIGILLTFAKKEIRVGNPIASLFITLAFALMGSLLGLGIESLFQSSFLFEAVREGQGLLTYREAFNFYQLGLLSATGITSIFGPALTMMKAAPLIESQMRP